MPGKVRVGGAWKDVSAINTRVGGSWKTVTEGWTKIGGTWKKWYELLLVKWGLLNDETARSMGGDTSYFHKTGTTYVYYSTSALGWFEVDTSTWTTTARSTQSYSSSNPRQIIKGQDGVICFVANPGPGDRIYRSLDSMTTSATVEASSSIPSSAVLATNGTGTWIAAGSNDLLYSTDNGDTWTSSSNVFGSLTINGAGYNPNAGLFIVADGGTSSYCTSPTGTGSWTARTLPFTLNGGNQSYFWFPSNSTYTYTIGPSLSIWRSSDLINWTNTNRPTVTAFTENAIRIATQGSSVVALLFAPSTDSPRKIATFYSEDNGDTWNQLPFSDSSITYDLPATVVGAHFFTNGAGQYLKVIGRTGGHIRRTVTI
jgi:hypothetical protein